MGCGDGGAADFDGLEIEQVEQDEQAMSHAEGVGAKD
jgi:hypothetical protein